MALDITISDELRQEGIAREFVNRIQNLRKEIGLEVTDKINVRIEEHHQINEAVNNFKTYIGNQTLANEIVMIDKVLDNNAIEVVLEEDLSTKIAIEKI